jgi:cytochrome b561
MALRNGPDSFGLVTRAIHWGTMLLVIAQLALGMRIEDMAPGLSNLWLYGLHKTLGFAVLALVLARIGWHLAAPPRPARSGLLGRPHRALDALWPSDRHPPVRLGGQFGHRH